MDQQVLLSLLSIIGLVLCSAFFSACETAFTSLNRIRIQTEANKGDRQAQKVLELSNQFEKLLSAILIGNNVVNIGASALATTLLMQFFPDYGASLSTIVMTIMVLIFGEISPKTIANQNPEAFAKRSATILSLLMKLTSPLTWLFERLTDFLLMVFSSDETAAVSDEELLSLVDEAEESGNLSDYEHQLIKSAIRFDDLQVRSIWIPRIDMVGVDINDDIETIKEIVYSNQLSRLIVYDESIDNVIGSIHEKTFSRFLLGVGEEKTLQDCINKVIFVPPYASVSTLLTQMQADHIHFAIVKDEYGGTMGMVTMEDILEELVGEIWDEGDVKKIEITATGPDTYQALGRAPLTKIWDLFDLPLDDHFISSSIGGFIVEQLEHSPEVNDTLTYEGLLITVLKVQDRRVTLVQLEPDPDQAKEIGHDED